MNFSDPSGLDCTATEATRVSYTRNLDGDWVETRTCPVGMGMGGVTVIGRSLPSGLLGGNEGAGGGNGTTWFLGVSGFATFVGGPSLGGGLYGSPDGDFGLYIRGGVAIDVGVGGGIEWGGTTSMAGRSISECAFAGFAGACAQLGGRGLTGASIGGGLSAPKVGVFAEVATTGTLSYFDIVRGFFATNFGAQAWAAYRSFNYPRNP